MGRSYFFEGGKDIWCDQIPETSIIYCFGVPRRIVHDNGPQFVSQAFQRFYNKFRIQSVSSTAYYPAANGLAEAFNKTMGKLLKKFVSKIRCDWDDRLGECLWAYRTTVRTPTKATPFSLVYGCEVFGGEKIEDRDVNSLFDCKESYSGSIILLQEREDIQTWISPLFSAGSWCGGGKWILFSVDRVNVETFWESSQRECRQKKTNLYAASC